MSGDFLSKSLPNVTINDKMWSRRRLMMSQYTIGIRDLKAHLSAYLEKAQKGHTVIITSHGKPVAQLTPISDDLMGRVKALQAAGLISWSGKKVKPGNPVAVNKSDKLVSDVILEMRNESLY
jgi:prevent-host-death family protein